VHDPELRATAVALVAAGTPVKRAANELGISRSTLRYWLAERPPSSNFGPCPRCWRRGRNLDIARADYAYLLGVYLGDGCISHFARSECLRISCDSKYPRVIEEIEGALTRVLRSSKVGRQYAHEGANTILRVYANHLSCLFPQHGPGKKKHRRVALEDWQREMVREQAPHFLRGCIQTDGCLFLNRTGKYTYLCCDFANHSQDILDAFCWACELEGIEYRRYPKSIRIYRRASVQRMVNCVGSKGRFATLF
jgi:Helix-turn-helix domain